MKSLTEMQQAFIENFSQTGNAKQSAIKAGYSEATAEQQGHNLKKQLSNEIDEATKKLMSSHVPLAVDKLKDLTAKAKKGLLDLSDVQNGTFTLNNTGSLGFVLSKPIINPPQVAILTTEKVQKKPVVINDEITIRSIMNICMSFDHRVIDGLEASAFLQSLKLAIETLHTNNQSF